MTSFKSQVEAEELNEVREALSHVKPYVVERSNEQEAKRNKDGHGVHLRNYFLAHPDERELVDEEWGLCAYMQFGGETTMFEAPAVIKQQNPQLYRRLEELGLFRIDKDLVEKAIADGQLSRGDLTGYAHNGERSPSLQVRKIR